MIYLLIKIIITACDVEKLKKYKPSIRFLSLKLLLVFVGMFNKSSFIPGEERDSIEMKRQVIKLGGLIVILLLERYSLEKKLLTLINDNFY